MIKEVFDYDFVYVMELKYWVQVWSLSLPRSSFHSFGASYPTDDKFLIIFFIFLSLPVATIIRVAIGQFDRHHGHRVVFEVFTETGVLRSLVRTWANFKNFHRHHF
jgi:hypothetical protein